MERRSDPGRPRRVGVLAVVAAVLAPWLLAADAPGSAELGVGPSRFEIVSSDGRMSEQVTVSNLGGVPLRVSLETRTLGHDLSGALVFPEEIADGRLTAERGTITLAPGESRPVQMTAQVPAGAPSLYAAFVATAAAPDSGGLVQSDLRVASLVLLTREGTWDESVEIEGIELEPAIDDRGGRVLVAVRNVGEIHTRPEGRVVFEQDGRPLGEVELEPETVIPGFARALRTFWSPPEGVDGPVDATVILDGPGGSFSGTVTVSDPADFAPIVDGVPQVPELVWDRGDPADPGRAIATGVAALLVLLTLVLTVAVWRRNRGQPPNATTSADPGRPAG